MRKSSSAALTASSMAENCERLAQYLRRKRQKKSMTQAELSERLGYATSQFVSNWETGRSSPPLEALARVIDILDLPQGEVLNILMHEFRADIVEKLSRARRGRRW